VRRSAFEILAARNENPRGDGQRAANKRGVRQLSRVRTDGDIEILGQQIDLSACHVLDEVDLWVLLHEAHDDVAKRECAVPIAAVNRTTPASSVTLCRACGGERANGVALGTQVMRIATDVQIIVLKDTGDWVLEERREETIAALDRFLH
jgi:hypothetical protein